ncbi:MAG: cell wall hydrolase [Alphaproteobacteria bacterium]
MWKEGEIDILARTLWGEARGEGRKGMEAVAAVVMNRVADPRWPGTVRGVVLQPWQFSAWNANDPNRDRMLHVMPDNPAFATALEVAREAVAGRIADPTGGANHYEALSNDPWWTKNAVMTASIGRHEFWRA